MTRRRRWIIAAGGLATVLVATALVLRDASDTRRLPLQVRLRMPAHWRIPSGLEPGVREGIEGLYSLDVNRRSKAAGSLEDYGPRAAPAAPHLIALLADGAQSPEDRAAARRRRSAAEEIMDFILGRESTGQNAGWAEVTERQHAIEALAEIGEPAVEPLIAALQDPLPEVRTAAAIALGEIGDERAIDPLAATPWLARPDWQTVYGCREADALAAIGGRGIDILIQRLGAGDPETRMMAAVALGSCRADCPRAVEALVEALQDADARVVEAAVQSLGQFRGDPATDALLAALDSPVDKVRSAAAASLGSKPDARAVTALIAAVERGRMPEATAATKALGEIGDPRSIEPLIRWLSRAPPGERSGAAQALGPFRDRRAVEPLLAVLAAADSDATDWNGALDALGMIGDARAVPALVQALGDTSEIGRMALGRMGPAAVEPLLAVLHDKKQGPHAADALGDIGDRRAFEPLLAATKSEDLALRRAATGAIGHLGDPRALAPLLDVLNDPELAFDAAESLGYLGDLRAVEPILAAVERYETTAKNRPAQPAEGAATGLAAEDAARLIQAADALVRLGDRRGLALLGRILPPDAPRGLGAEVGLAGVNMLAEALSDENKEIRNLAVLCLLGDESPGAIAAMLAAYPTLARDMRESLVFELAYKTRYPQATEALAEILRTDPDHRVRSRAAWGLEWRGNPVAAEARRRAAAEDPMPRVRKDAAAALKMLLRMNPPDADPPRWKTRWNMMNP